LTLFHSTYYKTITKPTHKNAKSKICEITVDTMNTTILQHRNVAEKNCEQRWFIARWEKAEIIKCDTMSWCERSV